MEAIVEEHTVPPAVVRRDVVRHMMRGPVHMIELRQFTVPWYFGGSLLGVFVTRRLSRNLQSGLAKLASQLRRAPQTHE